MTAERHQWQFRDQVIPARVFHLLKEKAEEGKRTRKITANDLLLLGIINSLVKPEADESGRGCYATDEYLANAAGIHIINVQTRLKHLIALGLVIKYKVDGQRYLEAEWSRTAEERNSMKGKHGKALRAAYLEMLTRISEQDDTSSGTSHKYKDRMYKNKKCEAANAASQHNQPDDYSFDDNSTCQVGNNGHGSVSVYKQDYHAAKYFREVMRSSNEQFLGKDVSGAEHFTTLRIHDKQNYWPYLKIYCQCVKEGTLKEWNLPTVTSCKQFRERFGSWIKNQIDKKSLNSTDVAISPEAESIISKLHLKWPDDSEKQLPAAVQSSLNFYQDFINKLHDIADDQSSLSSFAEHLLTSIPDKAPFVREWFEEENKQIKKMHSNGKWQGKLWPVSFQIKSFHDTGKEWASDYCYESSRWVELIDAMKGMK